MKVLYFQNKFYPKAKTGSSFKTNFNFGHERGVALEKSNAFFATGINHGGNIHFLKSPKIDLEEWVSESFGDSSPMQSSIIPGTFYKRMCRPLVYGGKFYDSALEDKLNQSFISLKILVEKLNILFETVEPVQSNLLTYGYRIREILLLACMEVESSWKAVLAEHNYKTNLKEYSTNDYVKLKEPMLLDGYEVKLTIYKSFPSMVPFRNWDRSSPTQSLPWYHAYHKTKHDRENSLSCATLINAVTAVSAAVIMYYAQFGHVFEAHWDNHKSHLIRGVFRVNETGLEKYEKSFYIPEISLQDDTPAPIFNWKPVNYQF